MNKMKNEGPWSVSLLITTQPLNGISMIEILSPCLGTYNSSSKALRNVWKNSYKMWNYRWKNVGEKSPQNPWISTPLTSTTNSPKFNQARDKTNFFIFTFHIISHDNSTHKWLSVLPSKANCTRAFFIWNVLCGLW